MKQQPLYLDYAATTPVDKAVFKAMKPFLANRFGNPHATHGFGKVALQAVDDARKTVADYFHVTPPEIIFTSGATESNNLALRGVVKSLRSIVAKPHIIVSAIEHHSVLRTAESLEQEGVAVTVLPLSKKDDGRVNATAVLNALRENTVLVSVMAVNNETGARQPVSAIKKIIDTHNGNIEKKLKRERKPIKRGSQHRVVFHTDAVQAIGHTKNIDADLISFSAHKIYGPKGVGGLVVKKNTPLRKIQTGGEQEYALRAGTLNVPGIVGCGKAFSILQDATSVRIGLLRDDFEKKLHDAVPDIIFNGATSRAPHISNVTIRGMQAQLFLIKADMDEKLAVSAGAACSAGSLEPSHVLQAMGLSEEDVASSIRVSFGRETSSKDIDEAVERIAKIVKSLRVP